VDDLSTNAKTRAQVLRAMSESQVLKDAEFNRAFVLMQYFGYLRRNPNDPQDSDACAPVRRVGQNANLPSSN
jgi:hypothetical protein